MTLNIYPFIFHPSDGVILQQDKTTGIVQSNIILALITLLGIEGS